MQDSIRVLLAGESWISTSTHIKGWDFFSSSVYEEGHTHLARALSGDEFAVTHMAGHAAAKEFPLSIAGLEAYDVVILSDIGANTLLLHPNTWLHGNTVPNRLQLLADWVRAGGAVAMCGGYLSFSGIYGSARFAGTPLEPVLPVVINRYDDRVEAPQGARVTVRKPDHPVVAGLPSDWPELLGYNEVTLRDGADLVAEIDGYPFIATLRPENGRSLVWTSDIGPHWCPTPFVTWSGYESFWQRAIRWLAGR